MTVGTAMQSSRWAIGIDMGGTFIDVVAAADDGRVLSLKHPREAGALVAPVLAAIDRLCALHRIAHAEVARIVHGSTVVTNLLLEQDAPPIAVLTNRGLRDVLALGRQDRRALYEPVIAPQTPAAALFPARLRLEIGGRVGAQGEEVEPLDDASLDAACDAIEAAGAQAAAVCLLFSHRRPAHEQAVREHLLRRLPGLAVSLSCEVDPKPREYERFLTTALDAYARVRVAGYLRELARALLSRDLPAPALMRSEGGIGAWAEVAARPIGMAMSGPCAALSGVAAGLDPTQALAVTLDVGGTSTDIGLVEDGRPVFADELEVAGLSLRLRCADVASLSVGGGSVLSAWAGGALRIGPQSQGAAPGPAAYAQGGTRATLTDALCVLGRLPAQLAGGVRLDAGAARDALARDVAGPLALPVDEAAALVVRTAAAAMAEALKTCCFQRGLDPADGLLVAAGGGGAQHVAEVAEGAGMRRALVLPQSGVIAALGLLSARPTRTVERACEFALDDAGLLRLMAQAEALLRAQAEAGELADGTEARFSLALCHAGQEFPIEIDWRPDADTVDALIERLSQRHARLRGMALPGRTVELRLLRAVFESPLPRPAPNGGQATGASAWGELPDGGEGPCMLAAVLTTVWVPPGWRWSRAPGDALLLSRSDATAEHAA